eukprot:jgi/Bigna1/88470/estExt_fgenesh1_pg.C_320104
MKLFPKSTSSNNVSMSMRYGGAGGCDEKRALFPAPQPARYKPSLSTEVIDPDEFVAQSKIKGLQNLVWLPTDSKTKIPCKSKVHLLAMEYCGYGLYDGKPSEERINEDLTQVYKFLTSTVGVPPERRKTPDCHTHTSQIILFGRSLGTGPTCRLASELCKKKVKIGGLVLQSPFTSILDAARSFSSAARFVMAEAWPNVAEINQVRCPVLFVHGKKDEVIPHVMSTRLFRACPSKQKRLMLSQDATHNCFHLVHDLVKPLAKVNHR